MRSSPWRRCALAAVWTLALAARAAAEPVGDFQSHGDIGAPAIAGSAAYDGGTQAYTLKAAGVNMWGPRDEFQMAWNAMKGDFILQARVSFVGAGKNPHRKAGLIVRQSLEADSPYADVALHGDGLTSLQYRKTKGAITEQAESQAKGPDVLQLERSGNTFTMSVAHYGEPFTVTQVADLALGDDVLVGLFACAHEAAVVETAVFHDVRVIRPAKAGFVPYRDYIGSRLELLDLASGHRKLLRSSKDPFEAPNWTRDGQALIVNASGRGEGRGRLHRLWLKDATSSVIDTGTAVRNNNDHVLSPDGKTLGISDQSLEGGQSTIFTLPTKGGTPKRITTLAPSYLHGFSPDGKWLVYTGGRGGEYDIYKIAADGSGSEIKLTDVKGLDDGPEYSPDGRYVYFNSTRSGTMQLWRMKADGTEPERVLTSELNDWFPHFSPDGKWIAFVSFGKDVDPSDHPYYKHVYIRVMPAAGGEPKVVAYVYGGQGTMNVPSWSPDSRTLAFVSNSAMDE